MSTGLTRSELKKIKKHFPEVFKAFLIKSKDYSKRHPWKKLTAMGGPGYLSREAFAKNRKQAKSRRLGLGKEAAREIADLHKALKKINSGYKKPIKKAKKRVAKPRKPLKIVKQKATHIGRKRPRQVPDWTVKNLRTLARVVKKRKCPPGYSKLNKKNLKLWLKKHE